MRACIILLLMIIATAANAKSYQVAIESIERGKKGEPHLILMSDGRVGFLDSTDNKTISDLELIQAKREIVEIELDLNHQVLSLRSIAHKKEAQPLTSFHAKNVAYEPTLVTLAEGKKAFSLMRRDYQYNSQCYNRAHVWAYEEYQRTALKSMKVFMFFTRRYIRNYNYHWWFHVTPAVQTANGLRTLDRRYTTVLHSLKSWSDRFVRSKLACPIVNKYNDYRNNQETQDCYHIPVSMYFWQPRDIEYRDNRGYEKTQFITWELNHAYWEAF